MDYLGFGYVVGSCPVNLTGQNEAASRLKCGVDKFGNSQYLCVPNFKKTAIVEYCYKGIVGLQMPGSCLVVNDEGIVDDVSCRSFTEGCTATHFKSSDLYKYPACHQINRKEQCFCADPKCPKIDTEMTTRKSAFVASNATMNNSATTLAFSNTTEITETGQIPAGAVAAITIASFMTLAMLFSIYMIYLYKKKKGKRDEERERVTLLNGSEDNPKDEDNNPLNWKDELMKESNAEGSLNAVIRIKINKEIRKQKKVEQTREWRRRVKEIQKSSTTKEQTVNAATLRKRKQHEKERIKREKIENSKRKEMERKSKLKEREEVKQRRKSLAQQRWRRKETHD
ncbi:uncharacterized protein LOC134274379 [Saccostrea cucullata]|uniref:uncharacterized protein LOC134274379 n=1 Tax=Saccostrea cuccullata TaxID=36930 RepID=UPI002ED0A7E5